MSTEAPEAAASGEVMASIDPEGDAPRLVIADVTVDDSWVSIPEEAAAAVVEWR